MYGFWVVGCRHVVPRASIFVHAWVCLLAEEGRGRKREDGEEANLADGLGTNVGLELE